MKKLYLHRAFGALNFPIENFAIFPLLEGKSFPLENERKASFGGEKKNPPTRNEISGDVLNLNSISRREGIIIVKKQQRKMS